MARAKTRIAILVYENKIPLESYEMIEDGQNFIQKELLYRNVGQGTVLILTCDGKPDVHAKFVSHFGSVITFRKLKPKPMPQGVTPHTQPYSRCFSCHGKTLFPKFANSELRKIMT